jgi:hypothetical protein
VSAPERSTQGPTQVTGVRGLVHNRDELGNAPLADADRSRLLLEKRVSGFWARRRGAQRNEGRARVA